MSPKGLIYSFVAKGTVVLAEHTPYSGNFSTIAVQCLQKLPSNSSKYTYSCDGHTFNFLLDDGFVFLVVADESMGRSVPFVFLERVKDDFKQRYGDSIKRDGPHPLADDDDEDDDLFEDRFSIAYNLDREFGPRLKEHMQYCMNHPEEMNKLSKLKAQITEVKGIMMDNIEKVLDRGEKIELLVDKTENLQFQADSFQRQGRQLRRKMWLQSLHMKLMVGGAVLILICLIWYCGDFLMESDIMKFDSILSLTEEEATSVVIPQTVWDKGYGGYCLTLVGRLLSHRLVHFEALKVFNHSEDLRRVLEMHPWIFDRNLVVLQPLTQSDDPMSVSLDWCPFFIHIHDLLYAQRSLERALRLHSEVGESILVRRSSPLPYGARLRASGPVRRICASTDSICPTYVWNSLRSEGDAGDQRRGRHILDRFAGVCGNVGEQRLRQLIDEESTDGSVGCWASLGMGYGCGLSPLSCELSCQSTGPAGLISFSIAPASGLPRVLSHSAPLAGLLLLRPSCFDLNSKEPKHSCSGSEFSRASPSIANFPFTVFVFLSTLKSSSIRGHAVRISLEEPSLAVSLTLIDVPVAAQIPPTGLASGELSTDAFRRDHGRS
ncbi:Vesicle-associated membrane protein [Sesamum alatum]|uniref:Vesicle-associated membrane protein n=1 Tax=Sesamum alatum TaxID=300844 RepID=A0AAE1YI68_9LAMI|nr:Vesicle-associated membrane protein [Sesamum alatum]